ncbi:MAG: MOSC domain-containing protein [Candidatus Limnocylindria bacterium]
MSARVISLQLHERHGDPPRAVAEVRGRVGGGLVGDSHERKAKRAVLVVDRSTLDDLGLAPGDLREQITVEGLRGVSALEPGTELRVGGIALRVNGPCEPCTHIGGLIGVADPEELRRSLLGRRGVACSVSAAGVARIGDAVAVRAPVGA